MYRFRSSIASGILIVPAGISIVRDQPGNLRLEIALDGGRATGYVPDFYSYIPAGLVDARLRIRGVCGALFNSKNQVRGINLFIPTLADIQIIERGAADPFMLPLQTVASVLRFTVGGATGHRVRIHGVVTLQHRGQYLFLTGTDGSIRVESIQQTDLRIGDEIDAVGFPAIGQYQPLLQEAVFRVVGWASPGAPQRVTGEQLLGGIARWGTGTNRCSIARPNPDPTRADSDCEK